MCLCFSPGFFPKFQLDPLHHYLPVPVPCLRWYPDCSTLLSASSTLYFVFSVPADSLDSFLQIFLSLKDCSLQVPPALMAPQDVCVCVCECVSMCGSAITAGDLDPMPGCLHQRGPYPGPPSCTKCLFQSGSLKPIVHRCPSLGAPYLTSGWSPRQVHPGRESAPGHTMSQKDTLVTLARPVEPVETSGPSWSHLRRGQSLSPGL